MSINKDADGYWNMTRKAAFRLAKFHFKRDRANGHGELCNKRKFYDTGVQFNPLVDYAEVDISGLELLEKKYAEAYRVLSIDGLDPLTKENNTVLIEGTIFLDNFK